MNKQIYILAMHVLYAYEANIHFYLSLTTKFTWRLSKVESVLEQVKMFLVIKTTLKDAKYQDLFHDKDIHMPYMMHLHWNKDNGNFKYLIAPLQKIFHECRLFQLFFIMTNDVIYLLLPRFYYYNILVHWYQLITKLGIAKKKKVPRSLFTL